MSSGRDVIFLQVEVGAISAASDLARFHGMSEDTALAGLIRFWHALVRDNRKLKERQRLTLETLNSITFGAWGRDIHPKQLELLGFVEVDGDAYRVRGMSRYIEAEEKRQATDDARSLGGKVAAQVRRAKSGSAQPAHRASPELAPSSVRADAVLTPSCDRADSVVRRETGDGRRETEDVRQKTGDLGVVGKIEKPTSDPTTWQATDFWQWAQFKRQEIGLIVERRRPANLGSWYSEAMMAVNGDTLALIKGFMRFGDDQYWLKKDPPLPFAAFTNGWDKYVRAEVANGATV